MTPEGPIMAATPWPTNGHLIADVARLGYIKDGDTVLDCTFGVGTWWKRWQPQCLVAFRDTIDFTAMPFDDDVFDAVAFDPPYVCRGGRGPTAATEMNDRYGLTSAPKSPAALQRLIDDGLAECARVVRPKGGIILAKTQSYITSGRYWPGTYLLVERADKLGLELVDELVMITSPRPQPHGRRQVHARRNLSTMFVLAKS